MLRPLSKRPWTNRAIIKLVHRSSNTTFVQASQTRPLPQKIPSTTPRVFAYALLATTLGVSIAVAFNHQKSSASITHSTYVLMALLTQGHIAHLISMQSGETQ